MTKINFYVLNESTPESRFNFCSRLAAKAVNSGMPVYLLVDTGEQMKDMSDTLWTARPESFLAHDCEGQPSTGAMIQLGLNQEDVDCHGILINLSSSLPNCFSQFQRVAEVVTQDSTVLKKTRERFGAYKRKGYPMETHHIR